MKPKHNYQENPFLSLRNADRLVHNFQLLSATHIHKKNPSHPPLDQEWVQQFEEIFHTHQPQEHLNTIPKILHVIWLGPKPFPSESILHLNNWLDQHPQWELYFWTDRENAALPHPMATHKTAYVLKQLEKYYQQASNYGEMSDLVRYSLLYDIGGVYLDHDIDCIKRIDSITESCEFMACCDYSFECAEFIYFKNSDPIEHRCSFAITNAIIASKPHHPLWHYVLTEIEKNWDYFTKHPNLTPFAKTLHRTYLPLTYGIMQYNPRNDPRFALLPALFQSPHCALQLNEKLFEQVKPWIFLINRYKNTWILEYLSYRLQ